MVRVMVRGRRVEHCSEAHPGYIYILQSACSQAAVLLHDQCIHCSYAKMQLKVDSN